jgi:hypothetical protein
MAAMPTDLKPVFDDRPPARGRLVPQPALPVRLSVLAITAVARNATHRKCDAVSERIAS